MSKRHRAIVVAAVTSSLLLGSQVMTLTAPAQAQSHVRQPIAQPAELGPMDDAGRLELVAPASVRRGAAWALTVNIAEVQVQGGGYGTTMVLLTDLTGLGAVQILRPVTIAARTGTQEERIAKSIKPGRYLIRVVFRDGWTKSESTALTPITVTR